MKPSKLLAAFAAVLLSGGVLLGTAGMAHAEDIVPPADPVVVDVVPEVVEETPVIEEVLPVAEIPAPAVVEEPLAALFVAKVDEPKYNDPAWWAANYAFTHEVVQCYKDSHGSTTNDGKAVTLQPYGADWPGDHYELLVVKAGSVDTGNGPGNLVYDHPVAGTPYFAPTGDNGKVKDVSHWIVCKGVEPEDEPDIAKADYGYNPGTCTTGQTVVIDNANLTNATWTEESLAKNGTVGPAEFDIEATLNEGAEWAEGQDGTFHVVLLGPDTKLCQNVVCEVHTDLGTSTNLDANGWSIFETKPGGTYEYVEGGLSLDNADGNSKNSWAHALGINSLADIGQSSIDYTHTSGNLSSGPGFNIFVDSDGNGSFESRLVGEPNVYGQDWWATPSSLFALGAPQTGGGFGSDRHGTINEWIALYGDLAVSPAFAFAYGTGGPSAGVFHGGTLGCADFAFDWEPEIVPVPALFDAQPTPPTCGVAGSFDFSGQFPNVDVTVDPEFDGPGTYTVSGDTHEGFTFPDGTTHKEIEVTVAGALLYQNVNVEGTCFIEPKQNEVVNGTPLCGETTYAVTTTVFTLDPVTGEYDDGVATTTRAVNRNVQLCGGLAFTGAEVPWALGAGVLFALLIGTTMVVGNRRGWFNQA